MADSVVFLILSVISTTNGHRKSNKWPNLEFGPNGGGWIEGYTTHGPNNLNGEALIDFDFHPLLDQPFYQTWVQNPDGDVEISPVHTTDRQMPLAMGRDMAELTGSTPDESLYNKLYFEVGTITHDSSNIDERTTPVAYESIEHMNPSEIRANGQMFLARSTNAFPTLGEWEQVSGRLDIDCVDGAGTMKLTVCNALPNGLYTLWEVGISKPGTDDEGFWSLPSGGLGAQVLKTDQWGNGRMTFHTPWCPVRECVRGESVDCNLFYTLIHHSDYIIYGGVGDPDWFKPIGWGGGITSGNHMIFPVQGTPLQPPLNKFKKKNCRRM
eukprot:CAMPEP_0197036876 /NCGR_PEP_ID=MMETSP1384-20130603/14242_1 /TAXON_ID=29189 /ORGANISM="Ammonia sp." /LENGTH=324 /DNA_ID=CAMNT_0042467099 /DNA_START=53 /DNA_END=1027 /DNA_ORIENTATION=-